MAARVRRACSYPSANSSEVNVRLIQSNIQLALHFGTGSFGNPEKPKKLGIRLGVESLRRVVQRRPGRTLDLIFKAVIAGKFILPGQSVNLAGQLTRELPRLDVLKPRDLHTAPTAAP